MTSPSASTPTQPQLQGQPPPGGGAPGPEPACDPVLCHHCGRTASNGISCQGYCVADSDY